MANNFIHKEKVIYQTNIDSEYGVREKWLATGDHSDCVFKVGKPDSAQELIRAHRQILMVSGSKRLESLLQLHKNDDEIGLPDVEPEIFRILLGAIYTHRFELDNVDKACKVAKAAASFELESVVQKCIDYMKSPENLNSRNVIETYELAVNKNGYTTLGELKKIRFFFGKNSNSDLFLAIAECLTIFASETRAVLETPAFLSAKPTTVEEIFKQNLLNVAAELELVAFLFEYALANDALPSHCQTQYTDKINQSRYETMILPALKQVRFTAVSTRDLVENAHVKALLSAEQLIGIISKINSPKSGLYPMPNEFTTDNISRGFSEGKRLHFSRSNFSSSSGESQRTDIGENEVVNTAELTSTTYRPISQANSNDSVLDLEGDANQPVPLSNKTEDWESELKSIHVQAQNELGTIQNNSVEPPGCLGIAIDIAHKLQNGTQAPVNGNQETISSLKCRDNLQFGNFNFVYEEAEEHDLKLGPCCSTPTFYNDPEHD